jgi:hypothetical protein
VAQKQRGFQKTSSVLCLPFFLCVSGSNRQRDELPVAAFVWDAVNSSLCKHQEVCLFEAVQKGGSDVRC